MTDAIKAGRNRIAKVAEANGETAFAREVRAGCWDGRNDVAMAIAYFKKKARTK